MKIKEIHSMKLEELSSKLIEVKKELMKVNAQVAVGTTPKNPKQPSQLKKTIARLKTELKTKEEKTK